ncbi:MAG: hypothetical protein ACJAZ2_002027 [Glaciecola sp.]|jgi:hypothetical protein
MNSTLKFAKRWIVILGLPLLLSSCGLFMWYFLKPTETWYFRQDFDRRIVRDYTAPTIADSTNISEKAIQLVRKKQDSVYTYWVDVEELVRTSDRVYIKTKIVGADGQIKRFLGGWLAGDSSVMYDFVDYSIVETKKGDLRFGSNGKFYQLMHLGDEMGIHHSDIIKPASIPREASFNSHFEGYGYQYSWVQSMGVENKFLKLYIFSYDGLLEDSLYVPVEGSSCSNLVKNHYIEAHSEIIVVYNGTEKFHYLTDNDPFKGFGQDQASALLDADFQNFDSERYVLNTLNVLISNPTKAFPSLRNSESLRVVYSSIKYIGLEKFVSTTEYSKPKFWVSDYGLSLGGEVSINELIDSLIYYKSTSDVKNYYTDFWKRRGDERTQESVNSMLLDIKEYYSNVGEHKKGEKAQMEVNDTLISCVEFDLKFQHADSVQRKAVVLKYYQQLMKYSLKQSAFNLLFCSEYTKDMNFKFDDFQTDLNLPEGITETYPNRNIPKWVK